MTRDELNEIRARHAVRAAWREPGPHRDQEVLIAEIDAASASLTALGHSDDRLSLAERIANAHAETMRHLAVARAERDDIAGSRAHLAARLAERAAEIKAAHEALDGSVPRAGDAGPLPLAKRVERALGDYTRLPSERRSRPHDGDPAKDGASILHDANTHPRRHDPISLGKEDWNTVADQAEFAFRCDNSRTFTIQEAGIYQLRLAAGDTIQFHGPDMGPKKDGAA